MRTILVVLIATICAAIGETFLSLGMRRIGHADLSIWEWFVAVASSPVVLIGVLFLGGFFFLYLAALSWADLSYVMPLTALSYLFAAILARFYLKEDMSWLRWTGIFVIVIGIALVASEEGRQRTAKVSQKPGTEKSQQKESRAEMTQMCSDPKTID